MKTVTNLLIICGLAIAPAACERDRDRSGQITPKAVEDEEKEAIEQKGDIADEKEDVAEAQAELDEQRKDVVEERAEFARQRDEFVASARSKMTELEARIDAIERDYQAGTARLKADAREDLDELIAKLEKQRAEAKNAYDAAARGTVERWNDLEKSTGEALEDLEETADHAVARLKEAGIAARAELRDADD